MKRMILTVLAVLGLAVSTGTIALANVPPAEPQGCHGAATVAYKQLTGDAGGQGSAIGGLGNSDGNPSNGQAHSAAGRGVILQAFLAANCDIGSGAHPGAWGR